VGVTDDHVIINDPWGEMRERIDKGDLCEAWEAGSPISVIDISVDKDMLTRDDDSPSARTDPEQSTLPSKGDEV